MSKPNFVNYNFPPGLQVTSCRNCRRVRGRGSVLDDQGKNAPDASMILQPELP